MQIAFSFGVVCAFATDSQVESGTRESGASVRAGIRDAQTFLNATQAHARWLLVNNYRELERRLSAMLTSSGLTISVQLGEFSRAVSVTTLTGMVRRLDQVRDDLRTVHRHTADLRAHAERLNAGELSVTFIVHKSERENTDELSQKRSKYIFCLFV